MFIRTTLLLLALSAFGTIESLEGAESNGLDSLASISGVSVRILEPAPVDTWEVVRYPGTRVVLDRLAYGAGRFVATTPKGTLIISTNGTHFGSVVLPTDRRLYRVRFVNSRFVAVGEEGTLLQSAEGLDWDPVKVPTEESIHDIAVGEGILMVVGSRGTILVSEDTKVWSPVSPPRQVDLHGVAISSDGFIAVGDGGTILRSWDGSGWFEEASKTTANLRSVASNGESLLACGDDGAIVHRVGGYWSTLTEFLNPARDFLEAAVLGDRYFCVARGSVAYVDLKLRAGGVISVSSSHFRPGSASMFTGLAQSADRLFGAAGTAVMEYMPGAAWQPLGPPANEDLRALAEVAGSLVAVGNLGNIVTSDDGLTWKSRPSGTTNRLSAVAGGSRSGVAVGNGGTILHSLDGSEWDVVGGVTTNNLLDVCHGNGRFVAVGERGIILESSDGRVWRTQFGNTNSQLNTIEFFDDQYWALSGSELYRSPDAGRWSAYRIPGTSQAWGLAGDRQTILLLEYGALRVSNDGVSWSPLPTSGSPALLRRMRLVGKVVVAVGGSEDLWLTANYVDWYSRPSGQPWPLYGVSQLRGALYAVGGYGVILRSAPYARLEISRDAEPTLRIFDADGRTYQVEYTDALERPFTWQPLPGARLVPGNSSWIDRATPKPDRRLYRATKE